MTAPQHIPQPSRIGRGLLFVLGAWLLVWGGLVFATSPALSGGQLIAAPLLMFGGLGLLYRAGLAS